MYIILTGARNSPIFGGSTMEYIYSLILQVESLQEALLLYALFVCLFVHLPFYIFLIKPEQGK
tara:strand:+ start:289 stop:477 length:189 start_codon:yes stop_codon:yes gene_type:complete